MNKKFAETLMKDLGRHGNIVTPDNELFLNELVSVDVPESSKFYETLPGKKQLVEEVGCYHSFSLRRVLRNRNAKNYRSSQWKETYGAIASIFSFYSSDTLSRNLRANEKLIEMMARCNDPFSLLGKFQSYDFDNPEKTLFIITRPVLVIPGTKDIKLIHDWEEANTTYEKESRSMGFLPTQKRVRPQEYFSH